MNSDVEWSAFLREDGRAEIRALRRMGLTQVIVRIMWPRPLARVTYAVMRQVLLGQRVADEVTPALAFARTIANEAHGCFCEEKTCAHFPRRLGCFNPCKKHAALHASLCEYQLARQH